MHECPYCKQEIDVRLFGILDRKLISLRKCPHCKRYLWVERKAGSEEATIRPMDIMYKGEYE